MTKSENRLFDGSASGCIEEMSRSQTVLLILFQVFNKVWNCWTSVSRSYWVKSIRLITLSSICFRIGGPQMGAPEDCFRIDRTPAVLSLLVISIEICDHLLVLLIFLFMKKSVIDLFVRASMVDLKIASSMAKVSGEASACAIGTAPE